MDGKYLFGLALLGVVLLAGCLSQSGTTSDAPVVVVTPAPVVPQQPREVIVRTTGSAGSTVLTLDYVDYYGDFTPIIPGAMGTLNLTSDTVGDGNNVSVTIFGYNGTVAVNSSVLINGVTPNYTKTNFNSSVYAFVFNTSVHSAIKVNVSNSSTGFTIPAGTIFYGPSMYFNSTCGMLTPSTNLTSRAIDVSSYTNLVVFANHSGKSVMPIIFGYQVSFDNVTWFNGAVPVARLDNNASRIEITDKSPKFVRVYLNNSNFGNNADYNCSTISLIGLS